MNKSITPGASELGQSDTPNIPTSNVVPSSNSGIGGIPCCQAAKTICSLSKWTLTNLKLQKLLYLAHMVSLGKDKTPLITETFSAWMYGPVIPVLYDRIKIFGGDCVLDRFYDESLLAQSHKLYKTIEDTWNFFGRKEGWELVKITHAPQGAWSKNYNPHYNVNISNEDILEEYNIRTKGKNCE